MESSRDDFIIAIRSAFLRKGNKQKFSLLSLILFAIIFLISGNFNLKIIDFNRNIIKEIIYISSFIVNVPEKTIKKSFEKVTEHFNYYDDYLILKVKLEQLKNKNLEKTIIKFENTELKKLIDDYFVEESETYAKVLIDKNSPFLRSIVINKGSKNGVKVGMVVYDNIYLIGKIVEVNFLTSRVLLISDINSRVPVTIQSLNIQGIMSGFERQKGKLQYIKDEKLISSNNKDLIVVTSGSGGVFKSGNPIGITNPERISSNDNVIVKFYSDFSQLKYVKILSHVKENINIDKSIKKKFKENNDQIIMIENATKNIKALQQQIMISSEVRIKLESQNNKLRKNSINSKKKLEEANKKIKEDKSYNLNIKFLELNLLYSHKCRKSFFKPNLFEISTNEYKKCVLNKGVVEKN